MNDEYLEFGKGLAIEAGKIMTRFFRTESLGTVTKDNNTPLTLADIKINQMVIDKVKETYEDHGVIGEEDSFNQDKQMVWVVDPIDGTIPFVAGIPVSVFSLALVNRNDGQPLIGVVLDPYLKDLFWAQQGGGAFCNDKKLSTSHENDLRKGYTSLLGIAGKEMGNCAATLSEREYWYLAVQSQVYSGAKVASGDFLGSIFYYGSPWDSAAISILVEEAGGIVSDLRGKPRRYDEFANGSILSANQSIHEQLLGVVKDAHNRD